MDELGFVNFENEDKNNLELELSRNEKIAELFKLSTNELENNYQILSLRPLAEIVANNFQKEVKKCRIYTISELNDDVKLLNADFHKLQDAKAISELKKTLIKEYTESIQKTDIHLLEFAAHTVVILHPTTKGPFVNWGGGYGCEVIAVIPNDNDLLSKDFKIILEDEYNEIHQLLIENDLIRKRTDHI